MRSRGTEFVSEWRLTKTSVQQLNVKQRSSEELRNYMQCQTKPIVSLQEHKLMEKMFSQNGLTQELSQRSFVPGLVLFEVRVIALTEITSLTSLSTSTTSRFGYSKIKHPIEHPQ